MGQWHLSWGWLATVLISSEEVEVTTTWVGGDDDGVEGLTVRASGTTGEGKEMSRGG